MPHMTDASRRTLADLARAHGIRDVRLLEAMRAVPRRGFVPPEGVHLAELDMPVPIGHEQVTTQPTLVAAMIEALGLDGHETVLEVGTGYGYQTALLASLAGWVWSIERWPDLADEARTNLVVANVRNAVVVVGDGTEGLPEHAPYGAVIVSAAHPEVPPPLVEQLVEGGRLVQPVGPGGAEEVTLFTRRHGRLARVRRITSAYFVPLVGRHGFAR